MSRPQDASTSAPRPPLVGIAPARYPGIDGRPLLAIRPTYVDAVKRAGGIPVLVTDLDVSRVPSLVQAFDAIVLPGGRDLDPRHYDEPEGERVELLDDDLGQLYLEMARVALDAGVPTLGVCLGCQVMNVALGGSLVQDLVPGASGVDHGGRSGHDTTHLVTLEASSSTARAMGARQAMVASRHHQALARVGKGLAVVGVAEDGVVEAVEHPASPFYIGVQWHPERTADPAGGERLFAALVEAARARV